jgi:hypothetical protein
MTQEPKRNMDTMGSQDMAIPEIKLVQNVGGNEAKGSGAEPGDFYCAITGSVIKATEGLDIIVVDIQKTRTYWGREEIDDEPPTCSSTDTVLNQNGQPCEPCPYEAKCDTPWLLSGSERRTKCLLNYNVLGIASILGDMRMVPMVIRASGISSQAVKELVTSLKLNRSLKGEYHRAKIHIDSVAKKTQSGEAFAFKFRMAGLIEEPETVAELKAQSRQLLGTQVLPEGVTAPEPPAQIAAPVPMEEIVPKTKAPEKVPVPPAPAKETKKYNVDF